MTDTTTTTTTAATTTTTDTTAQLTPADAAAKLASLRDDKAWGARLYNGDVATRREFDSLSAMAATAGGRLDAVLAGAAPPMVEMTDEDHPMTSRDMATVVGWLREDGCPTRPCGRSRKDSRYRRKNTASPSRR